VSETSSSGGAGFPIFLLGVHRGGTTFVQRLLNCHENVTVWGENAGLVSQLRAAGNHERQVPERAAFAEFSAFAARIVSWASPIDAGDYVRLAAKFVESIYATSRFWGFKEIRHGHIDDIAFLKAMFPACRLVLLLRRPRDVLISRLHVRWSDFDGKDSAQWVEAFAREYIKTSAAFREARDRWPDSTVAVDYETVRDRASALAMFGRIGIAAGAVNERLLDVVLESRVNSSFADVARNVPDAMRAEVLALYDRFAAGLIARRALDGKT
jgi:hypothetical protein